jgi:hypothetical protein
MNEQAGVVFEVEIVPHQTIKRFIWRSLHQWFIRPAPDPDPAAYEVQIKERSSAKVVYSKRAEAGVPANEIMSEVENDLEALDLKTFCRKYSIPYRPKNPH